MSEGKTGYREIEHTADWELEVWAPDLPELLRQAALGMYQLAGVSLQDGPRVQRMIKLQVTDPESLLVALLSELLYQSEIENLAYDRLEIRLDEYRLHVQMGGAPIARMDKEIKAVTYHRLKIQESGDGLRVQIVFDV